MADCRIIFAAAYNRFFDPPKVAKLRHDDCGYAGFSGEYRLPVSSYTVHTIIILNLRGAFLHIVSDALGSVGAIAAGLIMFQDRLVCG